MKQMFVNVQDFMGSGTGLADPATTKPMLMLAVWCLNSQQMQFQRS